MVTSHPQKFLSRGLCKKASQYGLYRQYIVYQDEGTENCQEDFVEKLVNTYL